MSCRAAIRAKVQGLSAELERRPIEREREVALARNYLDQALAFLEPAPPQLVALGGVSGTGKSTLARRLAPQIGGAPGSIVLRSDVVRKQLLGVSPTTRLDADAYRREVSEKVYARLAARAATLVAAGQAVIVDAVFLDPSERLHIERVAAAAEIPFRGLWLQAPAEVLAHRIDQRRGDASDATVAVLEQQLAIDPGPITWTILDVSESPAAIACAARGLLRSAVDQDQSGDRRTTLCSGAAT
ncbi:MAG: AAA family ATPase [Nitrospirota bacterium]|nr:AAA family ATPase [Nitrospirota bacterium]